MEVERYSHVMHISSTVTGSLLPELDAWDALRAALPAGTVSGAPKVCVGGRGGGRGLASHLSYAAAAVIEDPSRLRRLPIAPNHCASGAYSKQPVRPCLPGVTSCYHDMLQLAITTVITPCASSFHARHTLTLRQLRQRLRAAFCQLFKLKFTCLVSSTLAGP
eukprot:350973-Chlamydomonas_euryale.AAC.1